MVVACIGLAVALSGTGYAATVLPRNSVGTPQIKSNAVTSLKVRNGSLLKTDFKRGQLPAGARGPAGAQGPAGPPGAPNPNAANAELLDSLDSTAFLRGDAAAGGSLTGTFPNPGIAANAVQAAEIATDAVGLAEIGLNAVAAPEIATGAVGSDELADGSIGEADVGTLANGLRGNNIAVVSFIRSNVPIPSVPAGACIPVNDDAGVGGPVLATVGDLVVPFRPVGFPDGLSLQPTVSDTASRAVFEVCNRTASAIDPADTFDIGILAIRPS
jgi:hypothetical protein